MRHSFGCKHIVYYPLLKHKCLDFLSFVENSRRQVCIENLQYVNDLLKMNFQRQVAFVLKNSN